MGNRRQKLFTSAMVSGLALRLGIPGLAELIAFAWDTTRDQVEGLVPSGFSIAVTVAGLIVFGVVTYLTWEIYLKGARKGRKGMMVVLAGVITGIILGSLIAASLAAAVNGM